MNAFLNIPICSRPALACDDQAVAASARETQHGAVISGNKAWKHCPPPANVPAAFAPKSAMASDLLHLGRSKFSQSPHNIVKPL
jgi:hypothetical protein